MEDLIVVQMANEKFQVRDSARFFDGILFLHEVNKHGIIVHSFNAR